MLPSRMPLSLLALVAVTRMAAAANMDLVFCVLSEAELAKCEAMAEAVMAAQDNDDNTFGSYFHKIRCTEPYPSPEECMTEMGFGEESTPNIMVVDAGDVFVGGRYHSLVPILREEYEDGRDFYHAVALIKKGSLPDVSTLSDLRGKHACFAGVGTQAGWTIPIFKMISEGVIPVVDCNNHVKSTAAFFGESCAVNTLQDRYNPLGDNSNSLCEYCGSGEPGVRCTIKDPYAGFRGALMCLEEKGDIAFVKHSTVEENNGNPNDYELLCLDGSRASLADYESCSWGVSPGHFVIVSSAYDLKERFRVQKFMTTLVDKFKRESNLTVAPRDEEGAFSAPPFSIKNNAPYGNVPNLIFQDAIEGFVPIPPEDQLYTAVLQKRYGNSRYTADDAIRGVRRCDIPQMRLCITSEPEYNKCQRMRTALNAQLIKPRMACIPSAPPYSHRRCMDMISKKLADVTLLEAGDIYRAGRSYGLMPIMAEVYNLGTPEYYAVAVVKIRDDDSELIYLKRRKSCHSGVGTAAGWVIPISWLITNERVRDYGCDSVRAVGEYFSKSCAPGVRNPEFVTDRVYNDRNYWYYGHLCDLCHGMAAHYCDRTAMEDYYGHTGAFRCLVEGGGDVAFVKHTTVMENCDGKRKEWWARNQLTNDFQLLCRDGTRKKATDYRNCFLGKVKANAVITNPTYSSAYIDAFINLFKYAQQFYGQKIFNEFSFSMFYSQPPYADLIFQDATQKIEVLDMEDRDYRHYLGAEFLKAIEEVECFRSDSSRLKTTSMFATAACLAILLRNFI